MQWQRLQNQSTEHATQEPNHKCAYCQRAVGCNAAYCESCGKKVATPTKPSNGLEGIEAALFLIFLLLLICGIIHFVKTW